LQAQAGVVRPRPGLVGRVAASGQARPAGYALVAVQGFTGYVAHGGVGKKQVLGGQFGARLLRGSYFAAEKRDLKAQRCRRIAGWGITGDIPPLGFEACVGTEVARELQGIVLGCIRFCKGATGQFGCCRGLHPRSQTSTPRCCALKRYAACWRGEVAPSRGGPCHVLAFIGFVRLLNSLLTQ